MPYPSICPIPEDTLKARLGVTGTVDDELIYDLAAAGTRIVEDCVGPIMQRKSQEIFLETHGDLAMVPQQFTPGTFTTVEEWDGTAFTALDPDEYFLPRSRGAIKGAWSDGRIYRIRSGTRQPCDWPAGRATVRLPDYRPGRFSDPVTASQDEDGASLVEGVYEVFRHLWTQYLTFSGNIVDPDFDRVRPQWAGYILPRQVEQMVGEHAPYKSKMAGYFG